MKSKNNILSQKLNNFINAWFEDNKDTFIFTEIDEFDENDINGTLQKMIKTYKDTGKISIWTGFSENTIFGESTNNHKFRAWHDFHHVTKNLSFDEIGEAAVCECQKNDLPKSYIFERILLDIEINGQIEYLKERGNFVNNQIEFCKAYLNGGIKEALKID